jgi:hypothetical protein
MSGCYKHVYQVPGAIPAGFPAYSRWHHHLVFGLINLSGDVDLPSVCPQGIARITDEHTFLNWLVSALLGGWLYTPTSVEIWCAAGPAMQPQAMTIELEMTPERIERIRAAYPNVDAQLAEMLESRPAVESVAASPSSSARF